MARLLRRFDDAAEQVGLPPWALAESDPPALASAGPATLLGRRDITPENVVFLDDEAAALIDFDLARPAARVEEVANLLLWWAPWRPESDRQEAVRGLDPFARGPLLVDVYGPDDGGRRRLAPYPS